MLNPRVTFRLNVLNMTTKPQSVGNYLRILTLIRPGNIVCAFGSRF